METTRQKSEIKIWVFFLFNEFFWVRDIFLVGNSIQEEGVCRPSWERERETRKREKIEAKKRKERKSSERVKGYGEFVPVLEERELFIGS